MVGSDPGFWVSHELVAWQKEGRRAPTIRARSKHEHLIQHTTFVHGRRLEGYTFEGCVIGAVRVKWCSHSRSSWEVVVLGHRGSSCSRVIVGSCPSRGDGSCSPDGLWQRSRRTGFVDVRVEGSGT